MDTRKNIYVVDIDTKDPSLPSTAIQLLRDKEKLAISSSVSLTLPGEIHL